MGIAKKLVLLPLLSLVFLTQFTTPTTGQVTSEQPNQPIENTALACGLLTSPGEPVYGRTWIPDLPNSKLFTLTEPHTNTNKSAPSTASQSPQGQNPIPYLTARISHSEFSYSFRVSPGQKFIRLHFYPTNTYPGFEHCPAFFSVSLGEFTLLNNFTGHPWIRDMKSESVVYVKEFIVNVGDDEKCVNVTFAPSSAVPNAYAFVNGIELVSMPTSLYFPDEHPILVNTGQGTPYWITNGTPLELMYRINVGGAQVPPEDDTGMLRNWESEEDYADNSFSIGTSLADVDQTLDLKFTRNAKNYTAPQLVYRTAKTMGPNGTNNKLFNLTWMFPVDSGFTYLVRLHFCQLVLLYANPYVLVFSIYLATFMAEETFDMAYWSGGEVGVPLYKDYSVGFAKLEGAQETTKVNLSVQLHPTTDAMFSDAMLNGVEIFKASKFYGDIDGSRLHSNPNSPVNTPTSVIDSVHPSPITKYAIFGSVGSGLIVLCLLMVAFTIRFRKLQKKKMVRAATKSKQNFLPSSGACRCFSLSEIKAATNNFDEELIIGYGGFGNVYKGFIVNGATEVAIKRLKQGSDQGANEFGREIEMLSQLRYLHLVSLIGYCDCNNEMILVYDYMCRGTLRDHLYNTVNPSIPWKKRLQICIGTARGLHYLHSGVKRMIIHRDIKTTNILLDEKWVAKVSDFGLSKVGPSSSSITHVSTMIKGSFGYLDPEYYYLQHLTQKSDVYSFGVVLCEVLCARPAIIRSEVDSPVSLAMWFRSSYQSESLDNIIDTYLVGKIAPECLKKYAELAFQCIAESGVNRPVMGDVVWGLELALQLQDAAAKEQVVEMEARSSGTIEEEEESQAEQELTE